MLLNHEAFFKVVEGRIAALAGTQRSNCAGSALFIVGELTRDVWMHPRDAFWNSLSRLRRLDEPDLNCLIAWEQRWSGGRFLLPLGVTTSLEPLTVTSRSRTGGELMVNESFQEVHARFSGRDVEVVYYLPRALATAGN